MVDINQEILNNPDLGKASHLPYLDEVTEQLNENLHAKREDREPEEISPKNEYSTGAVAVHGFTTELQRRTENADSSVEADKAIADEDWNKAGQVPLSEEEKEEQDKKSETEKSTGNTTESSLGSPQEEEEKRLTMKVTSTRRTSAKKTS
jgi:hypothetical protein